MAKCDTFEEKTEMLRWAVDSMRSEMMEHFDTTGALEELSG